MSATIAARLQALVTPTGDPAGFRLASGAASVRAAFAYGTLGMILALVAWGPNLYPALALLLPAIWIMAPSRLAAFACATAYHGTLSRFGASMATVWWDSALIGVSLWAAAVVICGIVWALCWPKSSSTPRVIVCTAGALLLTLVPPIGAFLPGHPLVGMGYLMPKSGWVGVALMVAATLTMTWFLRVKLPGLLPLKPWASVLGLCLAGVVVAGASGRSGVEEARVAGKIGAVSTMFGPYPQPNSVDLMGRIGKMGTAVASLAGGEDGIDTVVFPESILGTYDPSLYPILELEILSQSRLAGQTVVMGAGLPQGDGTWQNIAIIFRPQGAPSYVAARQAVLVGACAPWSKTLHHPANWLADPTANIGGGIRARFMFCWEEYLPLLHLLSEARFEQQMVIAMANHWSSGDPLAASVQAAHTEGMAKLFGRKWVRSTNFPKRPMADTGVAHLTAVPAN